MQEKKAVRRKKEKKMRKKPKPMKIRRPDCSVFIRTREYWKNNPKEDFFILTICNISGQKTNKKLTAKS